MNLLLFSATELAVDGRLRLAGRRLDHLHAVLKLGSGDSFRIGMIDGPMGRGKLLSLSAEEALVELHLDKAPPRPLPLTLVVALPRPKMLRRILRSVAEFGVKQLYLINSYRVEKSFWHTPVLQDETLRDYLLQGLEQACDTVLPEVHCVRRFKPFVEDQLPALCANTRAMLAHPGKCSGLLPATGDEHSIVAIGPEGGFIDYEVDKLMDAGMQPVSLGPRILRVENAVNAVLGRRLPGG